MRCSDPLLHTLPDHVLLLIFAKISNPKSLIASFLISKRIASILSHSHSLSLQFPTPVPFPPLYHQIITPQSLPLPPPSSSDDLFSRLTNLLCRFNAVRCLRIELPCSCCDSDDVRIGLSTVFKWKAKAGHRLEIFSLLSSTLVRKLDNELEDEDEGDDDDKTVFQISFDELGRHGPRGFAASMHHLMLLLIARYPNLQSIEIVDSKKHGGLTIQGEELIKVRNALDKDLLPTVLDPFQVSTHFKGWYEPKLRLGLSGFEMERVRLVTCRDSRVEDDGDGVDAALAGEFEDDGDGVFREAMTQLLTKHHMKLSGCVKC